MLIQGQRLAMMCFVRSFCRFTNSFAFSKESYGSMSSCLKDIITCIITFTFKGFFLFMVTCSLPFTLSFCYVNTLCEMVWSNC
jgi:hypothetical protein